MAEFVLKNSEEMLPEFEQMNRVGLFNDSEIKSIIKKTTAHEYKLVRRVKDKKDFLAYIQYKIHLLSLIKKRRKKINYYFKKDEIEYAMVLKIHRLFKQCTFRWPEDIKLWFSHIEFCKEWNKKTQLSKIWTALLQIHGNIKVHFWAMAAKWELEDNHSVENARSIFMRGIRHHPENPKLWHEYFRMELMHAMKIRQRLALLQEGENNIEEDSGNDLLNGEAARVVYTNAVQAIPNDCKLKCGFLEISLLFSFFAGELINTIVDDVADCHNDDPIARSALAKLHINPHMLVQTAEESSSVVTQKADAWAAEKRCWEEYESSIEEIDTCEMWGEYVSFLHERICDSISLSSGMEMVFEISGSSSGTGAKLKDEVFRMKLEKYLEVTKRAHSKMRLNPELYLKYVDKLVELERTCEAVTILLESSKQNNSIDLKLKLLDVLVSATSCPFTEKEIGALFSEVSSRSSEMNSEQEKKFWEFWLECCKMTDDEESMLNVVENAAKYKSSSLSQIKALYLEWYAVKHGVLKGLQLYKGKLNLNCSPSLHLNKTMIGLLCTTSDSTAIVECFEDTLGNFGQTEPNVWLDYISYMLRTDPTKVGGIHWRAMKHVKPELIERFVTGYTLLHATDSDL